MARCPETNFHESLEKEKLKAKTFESVEPLLTCKYHVPQDTQVFLIFQFYFNILNLRLLLDLTHKVTY